MRQIQDYEKKIAVGFTWTAPEQFILPQAADIEDAIFAFKRSIPKFAARTLNTFERLGATDEQAKVIIEYGRGVDLPTSHIRTIENFGNACNYLFEKLRERNWKHDKDSLCALHRIVGRDEVRRPGEFRQIPVRIEGSVYEPPAPSAIDRIYDNGTEFLNQIDNIVEQATATFLFISRTQPFENANKRAASLAMNGILMSNEYYPLNIDTPPLDFLHNMADFYESANGTTMMNTLNEIARSQYTGEMIIYTGDARLQEKANLEVEVTRLTARKRG